LQETRDQFELKVASMIVECPNMSYEEIGQQFGVNATRIALIATRRNVRRPRGPKAASKAAGINLSEQTT
jgi:hypothetical protein